MRPQLHPRKRIDLIVHQPHLDRFRRLLDASDVQGYTVLPAIGGKGTHGDWSPGRLTDAGDRVAIWVVVSEEKADSILNALDKLFAEVPGVAFVSDAAVLRPERF